MFFLSDVLVVLELAGGLGLLLVAAWLVLRWRKVRVRALLTPEEWRLAGKLAAIVGLALVLYLSSVALDLPGDLFLYGRF